MIRVVVAEDSPTARELLIEILESDPEFRVVGQAADGAEAVEVITRLRPDLVTMDAHMPVMDGFEATSRIMVQVPTPILMVSSAAVGREVEYSLNAIRAGALMVVSKPEDPLSLRFDGSRSEFLTMAKAMASVKVVRRLSGRTDRAPAPSRTAAATGAVRLVAIAASTGGPAALQRILAALPAEFPAPIVVVQHMAAGFVGGLGEWLDASCPLRVAVAQHGEPLRGGTALLAPDLRQLGVSRDGRVVVADAPPVRGIRPSGTYLFESAAESYGSGLLALVLTGMGNDGVEGLQAVKAAGGRVVAQDEATSVVFGMPREAIAAGLANFVLGLDGISAKLVEMTNGGPL